MKKLFLILMIVATALAVVAGILVIAAVGNRAADEGGHIHSVAVLPLRNLHPDPETDWLGEGIAAILRADLGNALDLDVADGHETTAALPAAHAAGPLAPAQAAEAGKDMDTERVVLGTYDARGTTLVFHLEVVDVAQSFVVHEATVQGPRADVLRLLEQLTRAVAASFDHVVIEGKRGPRLARAPAADRIKLTAEEERRCAPDRGTRNPEAFLAYLRATFKKPVR